MSELDAIFANPALLAGLFVLVVIELGLMVWAVLDWVKRPAERVRGNRILWLFVILLVNIVGPIIYLTMGRLPDSAEVVVSTATPETSQASLDALYGDAAESNVPRA